MNIYRKKIRKKKSEHKAQTIPPEKQQLFMLLCQVCQKLGIEIRTEAGQFEGGNCFFNGKEFIYLNKNHTIDQQIEVLISFLKTTNLEKIYLSPKIRSYIEEDEFVIGE
jgi:hypothetical protein